MNRIIPVLVAASLAASGTAFAQGTSTNNRLTTGVAPGNSSGAVTPGIGPGAAPVVGGAGVGIAPNGTPPTVGGTANGGGMAGPSTTPAGGTPAGAMNNGSQPNGNAPNGAAMGNQDDANRTNQALNPGANSFTKGQARARMQHGGFTQVTGLHMDNHGIWRGKAMKNGQSVGVAMDYRGRITGQ